MKFAWFIDLATEAKKEIEVFDRLSVQHALQQIEHAFEVDKNRAKAEYLRSLLASPSREQMAPTGRGSSGDSG